MYNLCNNTVTGAVHPYPLTVQVGVQDNNVINIKSKLRWYKKRAIRQINPEGPGVPVSPYSSGLLQWPPLIEAHLLRIWFRDCRWDGVRWLSTFNNNDPRRPQYYGSGLGDVGFVEKDDDYEFLLDEALARDGLYRGMTSVISSLPIHNLIWTRRLQESNVFVHTGTFAYTAFIHVSL